MKFKNIIIVAVLTISNNETGNYQATKRKKSYSAQIFSLKEMPIIILTEILTICDHETSLQPYNTFG
jgi:hypothetical protein